MISGGGPRPIQGTPLKGPRAGIVPHGVTPSPPELPGGDIYMNIYMNINNNINVNINITINMNIMF